MKWLVLLGIALPVVASAGAATTPVPTVGGCQVFPASNPWNERVDQLPVAKNSAAMIRSIGLGADPELAGDLLQLEALGEQNQDLPLARGEMNVVHVGLHGASLNAR